MDNPPPSTPFPTPVGPGVDPATPAPSPPPGGWAVAAGRGLAWWSEGWRLFMASPVVWIVITVVFLVIMTVLAFIPFIGQIASSLLFPVLGGGVLLGARVLDRGGELTVGHLFACCNDKAMPLVILALLYFGGWFVIWVIGAGLFVAMAGTKALSMLMEGDSMEIGMALLGDFALAGLSVLLLMVVLAVPLIMAYWFAPALVVYRGDEPIAAMKSSFTAGMRNVPPFLVYSLVGMALAIVATIPLGLGWIVLAPLYGATIYTSYKDLFGAP